MNRRKLFGILAGILGSSAIPTIAKSDADYLLAARQARDLLMPGMCGASGSSQYVKNWDINVDTRSYSLVLRLENFYFKRAVRVITKEEIIAGEFKSIFRPILAGMLKELENEQTCSI